LTPLWRRDDELFWIMNKGPNFNSSNSFIVMPTCVIITKSITSCINPYWRLPFFAHLQFLQTPLTSSILHMYVEAWVSVIENMQSFPLFVVSSPLRSPCSSFCWQWSWSFHFWIVFPFFLVVFVSFSLIVVELGGGWHFFCHPKVGWRILFKFQYVKVHFILHIQCFCIICSLQNLINSWDDGFHDLVLWVLLIFQYMKCTYIHLYVWSSFAIALMSFRWYPL